jgi:shikimate kinase
MIVRRPLYEDAADLRIETTGRQVRAVAADIQQRLEHRVAKLSPT